MLNRQRLRGVWRRVVPNRQTVTLRSRGAGGSVSQFDSYTVANCRLKRLTREQLGLPGLKLPHKTRIIQVWQEMLDAGVAVAPAALPVPNPKVLDQITALDEDGTSVTLTIDKIDRSMMGECWNCWATING